MSLISEQIPNKALNGKELAEIAVQEFRDMLARDFAFSENIAYKRVAFTLTGVFHLGEPLKAATVRSRVKPQGVVEGEAPLETEPEEGLVRGLERDVAVENPNLARVHHDMPIRLTERVPQAPPKIENHIPSEPLPLPDPFPKFEEKQLRYDKKEFPEAPAPVDRDVSEQAAEKLGVKKVGGLGLKARESNPVP